MNKDLCKLSESEYLWLWRRRNLLTQAEAAIQLSVGLTTYQRMEADKKECRPPEYGSPLGNHELCATARRRSKVKLRDIAKEAGVSHVTFLTLEEEGNPKLVNFWRRKGFRFPK